MTASLATPDLPRLAAAAAPAGLFLLDAAGDATFVNPRLAEYLGVPAASLLGDALARRILGPARADGLDAIAAALDLGGRGETVHRVTDGAAGVEWLRVIAARSRDAAGIVGVVEDVTAQRQELTALERARRIESLGLLAGGIAHDINNLLVGIVGNATLAELDIPPEGDAAAALADLRVAAERATELTTQLLLFGGRGVTAAQPVDVAAAIGEALASLDGASRERVACELPSRMPRVTSDAARLQQAVRALVANALEATPPDGSRIVVRATEATVDDARRRRFAVDGGLGVGPCLSVEVSDGGEGMSAEALDRAFEPWVTSKVKRRGLGLAAVAGTVRAYRAAVEAISSPGEGTTMRMLLPIDPVQPAAPAPGTPEGTATTPGTILVVDDEAAVRDVTRRLLVRQGFEVMEAASGAEGLERLTAAAGRIGCVLLDLTMPGMDGEETLLRMREAVPSVRVVVTSGHSERDVGARLDGLGACGYLQKPFDLKTLLRVAREAMAA